MNKKTLGTLAIVALSSAVLAVGCSDDGNGGGFSLNDCAQVTNTNCVEIDGGDGEALLRAVNTLQDDTTVVLGAGDYHLDLGIDVHADGFHLVGQGPDKTRIVYTEATGQFNGIRVIGDDVLLQDLAVVDAPKDDIRIDRSNGVTIRNVSTTWTTPDDPNNGSYGIYPVTSTNVLVENSFAANASDSGLYVGQSQHIIVRNNEVRENVAGLEIENCQYADVYNNLAEDNTAGIVVFDLTGNPIPGHDIWIHDNTIQNNNHDNFTPSGIVGAVPPGVGTFAMAVRRVVISDNTYKNNQTVDIALIDGTVGDQDNTDPVDWAIDTDDIVGTWKNIPFDICDANPDHIADAPNCFTQDEIDAATEDDPLKDGDGNKITNPVVCECSGLEDPPAECSTPAFLNCRRSTSLDEVASADAITNYRTSEVLIKDNTHENTGTNVPTGLSGNAAIFANIIGGVYSDGPVDPILYDANSESAFSLEDSMDEISNDNHICVGGIGDDVKFGVAKLLEAESGGHVTATPADGLGDFGCTELTHGPVERVTLPQAGPDDASTTPTPEDETAGETEE